MIPVFRRKRGGNPQNVNCLFDQLHFIMSLFTRFQILLDLGGVLNVKHHPHRESHQKVHPYFR